jgi:hypothetical protein
VTPAHRLQPDRTVRRCRRHPIETSLLWSGQQATTMPKYFGMRSAGEVMPARQQQPSRQQTILAAADASVLMTRAVLALVSAAEEHHRRHRNLDP